MTEPTTPPSSYKDLRALMVNCTFTRSPRLSHTDTLLDIMRHIFTENEVQTDSVRFVDHHVAEGIYPDMTEHGASEDAWPAIHEKVKSADILVIGTPIWLGEKSSVCQKLIERLYGVSNQPNEAGQYAYCGKVGGCIVTGNEDGIKHVGMGILYSLQHIGYTIPPQSDAGWLGEDGRDGTNGHKADGDEEENVGYTGSGNGSTARNISYAAWNMLHHARLLKDAGSIPAHDTQGSLLDTGGTPAHDTERPLVTLANTGGAQAVHTVDAREVHDDHTAVAEDTLADSTWV